MSQPPFYEDARFKEALGNELGITVEQIVHARDLTGGLSGASVSVAYVHDSAGEIYITVVKTTAEGKRSDLDRDANGAASLHASWLARYIPKFSARLPLRDDQICVVSQYAGRDTTKVDTLLALMRSDQGEAMRALCLLRDVYIEQVLHPSARRAGTHHELMRAMLGEDLPAKIRGFDWSKFGIEPDKPWVLAAGALYPNPLHSFQNPEAWAQEVLPPSIAWVPIHGDLNAENILFREGNEFILIDFEKTRHGSPVFDLAFLFVWLVQRIYLDDRDESVTEIEFAHDLMLAFRNPESLRQRSDAAAVAPAIGELLLPLARLPELAGDRGVTAPEWLTITSHLALSSASLARSFYELRAASRLASEPARASAHRRNGLFYYALASFFLEHRDLFPRPASSDPYFECPSGPSTVATRVTDPHEAALALEFRNGTVKSTSVATRLMWRIPLTAPLTGAPPPGWRRYVKVEQYSFFSKCNMLTNRELAEATSDILVWADHETQRLPLVFKLDKGVLKGSLSTGCEGGPTDLRLTKVDLIPVNRGDMAWLGLRFEGGPCSLRQYLTWISARSFGAHTLSSRAGFAGLRLGSLLVELISSLADARRPDLSRTEASRTPEQPFFFQYLLTQDWPDEPWSGVKDLWWRLLATASRPTPDYPKETKASRLQRWVPPHGIKACYGCVPKGVTVAAHDGVPFNTGTKRTVFGEAEYLQWIIAHTMRQNHRTDEDVARLGASFDEPRSRALQFFWESMKR